MEKWEYEENRRNFYYDKLKFCGCGNPEDTLILIKNILNVINMKENKSYEEYQKELRECLDLKEEQNDNYGESYIMQEDINKPSHHLKRYKAIRVLDQAEVEVYNNYICPDLN